MMTSELLKSTGQIDTAARDRYVAREIKAMRKFRAKALEGNKRFQMWAEVTDEQIQEIGESLGRIYEHHFRVWHAV